MSNHQYFAQLNDANIVTNVAVVTHAFMQQNPERYLGRWVETFFNVPGKTYAGIGFTYDETTQDFTAPTLPIPLPID